MVTNISHLWNACMKNIVTQLSNLHKTIIVTLPKATVYFELPHQILTPVYLHKTSWMAYQSLHLLTNFVIFDAERKPRSLSIQFFFLITFNLLCISFQTFYSYSLPLNMNGN